MIFSYNLLNNVFTELTWCSKNLSWLRVEKIRWRKPRNCHDRSLNLLTWRDTPWLLSQSKLVGTLPGVTKFTRSVVSDVVYIGSFDYQSSPCQGFHYVLRISSKRKFALSPWLFFFIYSKHTLRIPHSNKDS